MGATPAANPRQVPAAVVILAAGEGTRMKSATPKVLHTIAGRSLLGHALNAARHLNPDTLAVVVRYERDQVAAHARDLDDAVLIVDQDDVPGTGRAVQCAMEALDAAAGVHPLDGPVVVMAGDIPLLDGETLAELLEAHVTEHNVVTILSTLVDDPTGYGRVVRDDSGVVRAIIEHRDASADQREIQEINSSIYVFDAAVLRRELSGLGQNNDQGEVYLTDVIAAASTTGTVRALISTDPMVVEGVNDRAQLAVLRAEANRRIVHRWMLDGVTVIDPATTWIDVDVDLGRDVTVLPGTQLLGATSVAEGATVGPDSTLTDMEIRAGATVTRTHGSLAVIGEGASVGPFAYLRPGTVLGAQGKIGTFVETKNAEIGEGAKVPHLSYIGDATVGEYSNVGAASVTVNYDGVAKHRTTIGAYCRTGSDNMFVAPVTVGDGAYTGAGSVIREDVPAGALAVSQPHQRTIDGWVLRRRAGTPAAQAAARAGATDGAGASGGAGAGTAAGETAHEFPASGEPVAATQAAPTATQAARTAAASAAPTSQGQAPPGVSTASHQGVNPERRSKPVD